MPPRRSARLQALKDIPSFQDEIVPVSKLSNIVSVHQKRPRRPPASVSQSSQESSEEGDGEEASAASGAGRRRRRTTSPISGDVKGTFDARLDCLSRPRETSLRRSNSGLRYIMGIDEAGRGPLAGPVVAAAAIVPSDIPGIVDSKKITNEDERERLYEQIVSSPGVRWAVAVVDATTIDQINILQATLLGMRTAAAAVLDQDPEHRVAAPCVTIQGCYVVCGLVNERMELDKNQVFALVDGNRLPKEMPCLAECIVKGDSKEYSIAAASILAKVTRDRLMHAYSQLYPEYNLAQHKGYPTASHMAAIARHGACAIHRRTFAPLKHMTLDECGRVVSPSSGNAGDET